MYRRIFLAAAVIMIGAIARAQAPAPGGGRGAGTTTAMPNATPEQIAALARINADLTPLSQALAAARAAITTAALAEPRDDAVIRARVDSVKAAEQTLASARADALEKIQISSANPAPGQVAPVVPAAAGRGGRGRIAAVPLPHVSVVQGNALIQMNGNMTQLTQALSDARTSVTTASITLPRSNSAIQSKVDAAAAAELGLAIARADALAKLQASSNKLDPDQLAALVREGGTYLQSDHEQAEPIDFNDHRGYVSLFDGVSLAGWDGNPKFWRVEGGAIVGESTPTNPSGNTYIVYRGVQAHDFTLKFEIKIDGNGGSGIQYRSRSGIPWRRTVAANVLANAGPLNLTWMLTGPQADFWAPTNNDTGQIYSENSPIGSMASPGQVVEGAGFASRRLMATFSDLAQLSKSVKLNDWNEYAVIARGGTLIHIINGQLMAVVVDDDPDSSNNWSGQFGIEIESTTKVSVRNIWLKKLN
jgi:hypothetical protein